ncbi:helix-turn-helix transcriptional regulator [Sorangium sp. So ce1000]|uniref:helix-turn-helix transcriptional regulator n=1 Tax=Sorangium sp. So ce1000 TaxID=3133325 RepID=UPI003F61992B
MGGRASGKIRRAGQAALTLLRGQEHTSLKEIACRAGVSEETAKRALDVLRDNGAPFEYVAAARGWCMTDPTFALPLFEPAVEDLRAAMTAAGLLEALGQADVATRAWALFDELDVELHGGRGRAISRDALRVTQSTGRVRDQRWVLTLLRAVRRGVVEIRYRSPWKEEASTHQFEPWQLWLHDGVLYVRGYSRTRKAPRTFRLAGIDGLAVLPGQVPTAPVPARGQIWGEGDPRLGVDEDRPDTAKIKFRGPMARWVGGVAWHPSQTDVWDENEGVLERHVPYRSCRELARRLASMADGLVSVEPPELRAEVLRILEEGIRRLAPQRVHGGRPELAPSRQATG